MKPSRAFRPDAFDHQLEDRKVLSHIAPRVLAHYQFLHSQLLGNSRVGAANHRLNLGLVENSSTLATAQSFASAVNGPQGNILRIVRQSTPSSVNRAFAGALSSVGFGNSGIFGGNANLGSTLCLGAQNGLLFNNGLGVPGASVLNSPGLLASTGLAFNQGLGTPGLSTVSTGVGNGLRFNNGLGVPGFTSFNSVAGTGFGLGNNFISSGASALGVPGGTISGIGTNLSANPAFTSLAGTSLGGNFSNALNNAFMNSSGTLM